MTDPTPGSIVHVELASKDPAATRKFLEAVFGWKFKKEEMPPPDEYWTFEAGNGPRGGVTSPMGSQKAGTLNYVLVDTVDAAVKKIVAHGGTIMMPKTEIPSVGWFAVYELPGGIVQAVFQTARKS
ncbi:MAG: VOC family protein [Thermoplasmata archaeon]|nr:VOC family protein [Thermoplasmata archaeon]